MRLFKQNSIRQRFTLGLAIVITVIMFAISTLLILYNSHAIEKNLKNNLERLSVLTKESLASALWQYNYDYVKDYIEALFLYDDLVFVCVETGDTVIVQKARPDHRHQPADWFHQSPQFIVKENTVIHKQIEVGRVFLAMSRERIDNLVLTTSGLAILLLCVVNAAVFATNYLLSRWYLFKPLFNLEASVRTIAAGDMDASIDASSQDEIGQLARSVQRMMDNLKRITASRDDLNREIRDRKKVEADLKDSLNEKEVLLREIHHRVKNNLQIVQSLLSLQSARIDSPMLKQAVQNSNDRIRSMALIHETLYRSEDISQLNLDKYFNSIVSGLYKVCQNADKVIDWQVTAGSVDLNLDKSIACGLIINELVTNSLKYAFQDRAAGSIRIGLWPLSDRHARLRVEDDGKGLPDGFDLASSGSLGLQIVRMLAEDQLAGKLEILDNHGVTVTLRFPLESKPKG